MGNDYIYKVIGNFMKRHLKLSESEKSNRATSIVLKKDAKRIKLQNEDKKKIIAMIKETRKNQLDNILYILWKIYCHL